MAACKPVTFTAVSRLKFKAIRARIYAQADKTEVLGDTGTAEGRGMKATWAYDEKAQTLTVQCVRKPFWMSDGFVKDKMQALVESVNV
jgi:hypothetical protein